MTSPTTARTDHPTGESIVPFTLDVPEQRLVELRRRLALTRWPDRETVPDTGQGPQLAKVQALVQRWATGYDWRPTEALLNGLGQHTTTIDGLDVHFLHVRSPEPDALPLVMTHGWPGSVLEFRKVIAPLVDPGAHGGDPADAFHLVIPSLPGFGFSGPAGPGWDLARTAEAWITLMRRLDYARWGAHGGDLGAGVTDEIAARSPEGLVGTHLTLAMFMPTPQEMADADPQEQAMLADAKRFWDTLSGYAKEQATRPQTIGYSLADSPVGLAAWLYAMFQDVGGTRGDAEASFPIDELLDAIMLYWLPNTGASAARMYWEMTRAGWSSPARLDAPITVPVGFTMMPAEHVRKSRRWLQRRYTNLVHLGVPPAGGHFAALEQPDAVVADLRATFRALR